MINSFTFWQSIARTPWWIYPLFLYVLYLCYYATKKRTVFISTLYAMSVFCMTISFLAILIFFDFTLSHLTLWFEAALGGVLLGWLQFRLLQVKAFKNENKLFIPGTKSAFVMMLLLFLSQYIPSFHFSFHIQDLLHGKYTPYLISLYGISTGLMFGRTWYSYRCLKTGPFLLEHLA